jgi:RNA polymerase sigma-70 factor (ECF subfamily)
MVDMSDEEILEASYKNPARFGEIFDRHSRRFLKIAKRSLRSPDDAEDAVQSAFVKIYKYGRTFSFERGKFSSWANSILKNCITDQIKKYERESVSLSPEMENMVASEEVDPNRDRNYVEFVLKKLGKSSAEVLRLRYMLGHSFKQIGKMLNIKSGAARVRAYRAKKEFEAIYNQYNLYGE